VSDLTGDEFGLFTQAVIRSWLLEQPVSPHPAYPLPDYPASTLYMLLDGLRLAIMKIRRTWDYLYPFPGDSFFPCSNQDSLTPAKIYVLYAAAFKGLVNWPQGFYEFLNAYRVRDGRQPSKANFSKDLGSVYMWINNHPQCRFAREAYDQYIANRYPALLRVNKPTIQNNLPDPISPPQAVRILRASEVIVERLAQMGWLTTSRELKDGKLFHFNYSNWVSEVEVAELQQKWVNGIPMADAAKVMDISEATLLRLIDAGLIEANVDKRLSCEAITGFINKLKPNTRGWFPRRHPQQPVPFDEVISRGLDPAEVMRLILAKEIRGYWFGGESRLSRLKIHYQDVEELMSNVQRIKSCDDR